VREIKFRAWHKTEKKMTDGFFHRTMQGLGCEDREYFTTRFVLDFHGCPYMIDEQSDTLASSDQWGSEMDEALILTQFTGLLDKEGVEIYEGDIVAKDGDHRRYEVVIGYDGVRPVHPDQLLSFSTSLPSPSIDFLPLNVDGKHPLDQHTHGTLTATCWKVVSNVHQNPELVPK
jgi:uncharacterized phage protein (TIGR01671 family)